MVSICSDKKAAAIFQFKIYLLRERERESLLPRISVDYEFTTRFEK